MAHVTFIGVTGSCGKTMTTELIAALLSTTLAGHKSWDSHNRPDHLAQTILQVTRRHDFCVLEVSAGDQSGQIALAAGLVKPEIGVVTAVGTDHISAYRTVDAIADEKSRLVAALPPHGTAVLNADDPRVLAMQARTRARVLTYGVSPGADVRAEDIAGRWPDRLSFTVLHAGESYRVQTQLCGEHWVPSVLAALTAATVMGIPLREAVATVATVPPYPHRMSPVESPDGVTFVLDDAKAPLWSMPLFFQFVEQARAARKIIVMGTITHFLGNPDTRYRSVARLALEAADHVVFVGQNARKVLPERRLRGDALCAVPTVEVARRHLAGLLRPGDLVFLKGSRADRLAPLTDVRIAPPGKGDASGVARQPKVARVPVHVVVGLGNPGERSANTPHNVGQRVLDLLATTLDAAWTAGDDAMVARADHPGGTCYLVKPLTQVNATGPALRRLADRLGFGAADCILLHDDLDLPLGVVRTRMSGNHGGHRGVRSVLEAFETFDVRRVKIGVGRPAHGTAVSRYVVSAFSPEDLVAIDKAAAEAAARVRELAGVPRPRRGQAAA